MFQLKAVAHRRFRIRRRDDARSYRKAVWSKNIVPFAVLVSHFRDKRRAIRIVFYCLYYRGHSLFALEINHAVKFFCPSALMPDSDPPLRVSPGPRRKIYGKGFFRRYAGKPPVTNRGHVSAGRTCGLVILHGNLQFSIYNLQTGLKNCVIENSLKIENW